MAIKISKRLNNAVKYSLGFIVCILIRLIPFRLPNIEPVMATIMPFAKKFRWMSAFVFGFLSIVLFDVITRKVGMWTWITALMYGLVGIAAGIYLCNKAEKIRYYVGYSIVATLVYDFVTGPIMSTFIWNQTFMQSLIGQIPFTISHLAGNIAFAVLLSPAIFRWITDNKNLETSNVVDSLKKLVTSKS